MSNESWVPSDVAHETWVRAMRRHGENLEKSRWTPEYTTSEHGLAITVTQPQDPAYALLLDDHMTVPDKSIHRDDCYICEDPEFARMGLPLCHACYDCDGHVPADDIYCWDCGKDQREGR